MHQGTACFFYREKPYAGVKQVVYFEIPLSNLTKWVYFGQARKKVSLRKWALT
jgi:hypothetical protein